MRPMEHHFVITSWLRAALTHAGGATQHTYETSWRRMSEGSPFPLLSPLLLFLQPEGEGTQGRGQRSPAGNNKILRGPKFRADACGQVLDPSRVSPGKVVPDQTAEGITEQKCKTRVVNMELEVGIGQFEEQIGCLRERGREGGQPEGEGGGCG